MRLIYIFENKQQELYHATLRKNVQNIRSQGLKPNVGKFTREIYGSKAKPLIFAASRKDTRAAYCSLISNIASIVGHYPSAKDLAKHGAILIINKDAHKFKQYKSNRRRGSLESNDFYSTEPVNIDRALTGDEVIKWIKDTNADWGELK